MAKLEIQNIEYVEHVFVRTNHGTFTVSRDAILTHNGVDYEQAVEWYHFTPDEFAAVLEAAKKLFAEKDAIKGEGK